MGILSRANAYLRHDTTTGVQLREMDALRGWACLGVIMLHCVQMLGNWDRLVETMPPAVIILLHPARVGMYGVDAFFFISGFLLYLKFGKYYLEGRPRPGLAGFYKRRFLRIAPAYYASVVIIVVLGFAGVIASPNFEYRGAWDVIAHLAFLHNLFLEYLRSINNVFWTLAVEFQFYLILPFFAVFFHGKRWRYALPGVLFGALLFKQFAYTTLASAYYPQGDHIRNILYGILGWKLEQFAVGMCFCELWLRWDKGLLPNPLKGRPALSDMLAASGVVILFGTLLTVYNTPLGGYSHLAKLFVTPLVAVVMTGVIFMGMLYGKYAKMLLANQAIEFLGIISYSAYIWHLVVLVELTREYKHLRGSMSLLHMGGLAAFALAMTLVVSLLSYLFFERPFLKKSVISGWLYGGKRP